jgi:hypothetical protein
MIFDKERLDRIFNRTSGYCHICHRKLCRNNYGKLGARGAWEVEHSIPQCNGGTHHGNNLFAAHIICNRKKGRLTSRTARNWNGKSRAPMSIARREEAKDENTLLGAVAGGLAGFSLGGPVGAIVGALAGSQCGRTLNPDKTD